MICRSVPVGMPSFGGAPARVGCCENAEMQLTSTRIAVTADRGITPPSSGSRSPRSDGERNVVSRLTRAGFYFNESASATASERSVSASPEELRYQSGHGVYHRHQAS